jgi:hypothetical protein
VICKTRERIFSGVFIDKSVVFLAVGNIILHMAYFQYSNGLTEGVERGRLNSHSGRQVCDLNCFDGCREG